MEACPQESTKRSRSGQSGRCGWCRRNRVHRTYAAGASAIGVPGWPDWACSTASIDRARMALMLRQASSSDGGAEGRECSLPSTDLPSSAEPESRETSGGGGEGKIIVQGSDGRSLYLGRLGPYL